MNWVKVSEARYWEMLEILPPALQTSMGFLVGEPSDHRMCRIERELMPRYAPFVEINGEFYEGSEPMTESEFRELQRADVLANVTEGAS